MEEEYEDDGWGRHRAGDDEVNFNKFIANLINFCLLINYVLIVTFTT